MINNILKSKVDDGSTSKCVSQELRLNGPKGFKLDVKQ